MLKWEDTSSYSQNDKEKIPHAYDIQPKDNSFRLCVHRLHGIPNIWFYSLDWVSVSKKELRAKTIVHAQAEAIELVRKRLKAVLAKLDEIPVTCETCNDVEGCMDYPCAKIKKHLKPREPMIPMGTMRNEAGSITRWEYKCPNCGLMTYYASETKNPECSHDCELHGFPYDAITN